MRRLMLTLILAGAILNTHAATPLEAGFARPPKQAHPLAWWHWINGNITKEGIRADLEDMKRVGIAGAQILDVEIYLPPGPVRYGTDAWYEHVQYAMRTAHELDLELDIANAPGWSASAGPWITPDRSMKQYVWSEMEVEGGDVTVTLPEPPSREGFYRDALVLAVPANGPAPVPEEELKRLERPTSPTPIRLADNEPIAPEQVLDLTASVNSDGVLHAPIPKGRWTILRFGFTTTGAKNHPVQPEAHGLECDKFDADAATFQFGRALGRIIRDAGPLAGETFAGILFDSFEAGFQNWTDTMPEKFERLKGYDMVPFIPALTGRTIASREESEAFLRDFRSVTRELILDEYFGTMQRLAHEHGLKVYAEAQGGPLDPLICNERVDVPMNEFWMPRDGGNRVVRLKQVASVAQLLGKPIVGAEAFTARPEEGRWLATPATMKAPGDLAFTAGINRFIFHTYIHQPYEGIAPGFTLGRYGTHFGRLNTWWPFAKPWMDYLARCQFLLQQGETVADISFMSNPEFGYGVAAKYFVSPEGYDYTICYPRHLAEMTWEDGAFHRPSGWTSRVLVLLSPWRANIATLRELKRLVDQGALVVGARPVGPNGLLELRDHGSEWEMLADYLWSGRVQRREALEEVLEKAGIGPDFVAGAQDVYFIHRATNEGDLYFLTNQSSDEVSCQADFRAGNYLPELWDAVTGQTCDAPSYEIREGRVQLPLELSPFGSIFVVFRRPATAPSVRAASKEILASVNVPGPWEVAFQPDRGAPDTIRMDQLVSWTTSPDPGMRYFSGISTYTAQFDLSAERIQSGQTVYLDLGKVCDVAEVTLNGLPVGIVWTSPFALDVSDLLRSGANTLQVAVANRWVNRIIGDENLPADALYAEDGSKFTIGRLADLPPWLNDPRAIKKRKRFSFATWHFSDLAGDSNLIESGLLGPVRLEFLRP
ncbi:hypothetical protein HQ520_12310 [bacterium]|nr:hypothetical protein [bacterium]